MSWKPVASSLIFSTEIMKTHLADIFSGFSYFDVVLQVKNLYMNINTPAVTQLEYGSLCPCLPVYKMLPGQLHVWVVTAPIRNP